MSELRDYSFPKPITHKFIITNKNNTAYRVLKRLLDILLALLFILLFLPLFILLIAAIKLDSKGSAFFVQDRVGRNGEKFKIYKFRTMVMQAPRDVATAKLKDSNKYITRMGKFLRKTSLDELPQLFNILKGEMSFVGPRPLVLSEEEIHAVRLQKGIYGLRPGLTGLAQINGRDLLNSPKKLAYDEQYLKTICLKTDFIIAWKSVYMVLKRQNVVEGEKLSSQGRCPIQMAQNNKAHDQ
jgi:Sugar transferases involved in lipopolysaccharide synthesis